LSAQETIDALEEERCRALVARDLPALERLCAEELVYTHTSTRRDTKTSYLHRVRTGFYEYLEFRRGPGTVTLVGSTALVTGSLWSRVRVDGVEKILDNAILAVWVEQGGAWRFVAYQTTPIPAPVAPPR
jgi:hypothetical protein